MKDAIKITIIRNCNPDGSGGEIVDNAIGVFESLPDGTPILNAIAAAFEDAYGLHEVVEGEGETVTPVSPYRNISYRMRMYATEITTAYIQKKAAQKAKEEAGQQTEAAIVSVTIVEGN